MSKWLILAGAAVALYVLTRPKGQGATLYAGGPPGQVSMGGVPASVASTVGGPPGSSAIDFVNRISTSGCTAVAAGKVGASAAKLGCSVYQYLTPVGQAAYVYEHGAAAAVTAGKAVGNGVVQGAKGVASAANAVKGAASNVGSAAVSVVKSLNPFSW
jgi:hypothetical protein